MHKHYINLEEITRVYCLEKELCQKFAEFGLIEIRLIDNSRCIPAVQLSRIKAIVDLHEKMGVNKEGIEIILSLREQLATLRKEKQQLLQTINRLEEERHLYIRELPEQQGLIIEF